MHKLLILRSGFVGGVYVWLYPPKKSSSTKHIERLHAQIDHLGAQREHLLVLRDYLLWMIDVDNPRIKSNSRRPVDLLEQSADQYTTLVNILLEQVDQE